MKLTKDIIEETVSFKKRQPYIIFIFFILLAIPFVFSIINFTNLKDCQSKPSNGCPKLSTNTPINNDYAKN